MLLRKIFASVYTTQKTPVLLIASEVRAISSNGHLSVKDKCSFGSMYVCTSRISFSISQMSPLSGSSLRTAIQSTGYTIRFSVCVDKRFPSEKCDGRYLYSCFLVFNYFTIKMNFNFIFYTVLYQKENIKKEE